MKWPRPTRSDHDRFCKLEGWERVRDARVRMGTHHVTYELTLPDGRVLRTRISHPPDRTDYGDSLWRHILRDQLQVDDETFWACVRDGAVPPRGVPAPPKEAVPLEVVNLLVSRVGLTPDEVVAMGRAAAVERLGRYWTEGT